MAFEVSQFSNKGLELLGQLSSHKSLVVKNILAAEKAYTADAFEQNIAWWTQETTTTMAKVNAIVPLTLMPISCAAPLSSETASIA